MTTSSTVVKAFGDAVVLSYERTFDDLTITMRLWDDSVATLVAKDVKHHHDTGTWEIEGVVRAEALDDGEHFGYAIVDTDHVQTLTFSAKTLRFIASDGSETQLS